MPATAGVTQAPSLLPPSRTTALPVASMMTSRVIAGRAPAEPSAHSRTTPGCCSAKTGGWKLITLALPAFTSMIASRSVQLPAASSFGGPSQAPSSTLAVLFTVTVEAPPAAAPLAPTIVSPSRLSMTAIPSRSFVVSRRRFWQMMMRMWMSPSIGGAGILTNAGCYETITVPPSH